jgi:uncharacterized protein with PIN domain
MLGKFCRWLRILGYDVDYRQNEIDKTLINLAMERGRILLTKDVELYKKTLRAGVEAFLLKGENEAENLASVARCYGLKLEFKPDTSRCPKCNFALEIIPIEEVRKELPTSVLKSHQEFWRCTNPKCRKIYWRGSHWKKIKEKIESARKLL